MEEKADGLLLWSMEEMEVEELAEEVRKDPSRRSLHNKFRGSNDNKQ